MSSLNVEIGSLVKMHQATHGGGLMECEKGGD